MTTLQLAFANLRHFARTHVAVSLGIAAAVAVLAGSFLVGHSVRASLADLTSRRLGRVDVVVAAENPFPQTLAARLHERAFGPQIADPPLPMLALEAAVAHDASRRRAGSVQLYGVTRAFFAFHGRAGAVSAPLPGDVLLSPDLTRELGAAVGDTIVIRVARPTDIPLDSLQSMKDDVGQSIRLRVAATLMPQNMGEFSLAPGQGPVRAAFMDLGRLQARLNIPDRVNTVLLHASAANVDAARVQASLREIVGPDDLGLNVSTVHETRTIVVESATGLIPDATADAIRKIGSEQNLATASVFTWLANRITIGDRVLPYSMISGLNGAPADPSGVVLNDWAARDLGARTGDEVEIEYFRWANEGRLVTERTKIRVAGVVPIEGVAADRRLSPDYPGVSESATVADWDPPFPIDLKLVRPIDEQYWDRFKATPKAFLPLELAQRLWRTRYGAVTSVRIGPVAEGADLEVTAQRFRARLTGVIDPASAGFNVIDVRAQNLGASAGATDFGAYFSYFSFFLMVSALLLAGLFFRLSLEQRLPEIGVLRATGFSIRDVRRVALVEGVLVALAGIPMGLILAIKWAELMMFGLRTWWVGAVGTTSLVLHVDPASLVIGAIGGLVAAVGSIWLTARGLARLSPRALLTGAAFVGTAAQQRGGALAIAALAGALALTGASGAGLVPAAGGFFGAGALVLVGGLAAMRWRIGRQRRSARSTSAVRLGLGNLAWRPGRSLTSAGLVAAAVFLLVSVDSFRKRADVHQGPASGTGGFALIAESALPIVHDPGTAEGRSALGLDSGSGGPSIDEVSLIPARLRPGDDASCLNLYRPTRPRILGVTQRFIDAGRFRFARTLAVSEADRANPWRLLGPAGADGAIPAIADATSLQYVLHVAVGDELMIDTDTARPLRLRIVGALDDSVLQGELLIAESAFLATFPDIEGYRALFVEVAAPTPARLDDVTRGLEDRLDQFGLDVEDSARKLDAFHRVENTYLSTFQSLGGLGLLLGTLGLAAIVARNVLERRRELALLGAAGFTAGDLRTVVLSEQLAVVVSGIVIGVAAAIVAIAPILIARGGGLPALPFAWVGIVLLAGVVSALGATRTVRKLRLVAALRSE